MININKFNYTNNGDDMKNLVCLIIKVVLILVIVIDVCYFSFANSIRDDVIKESIKSELLTGFIYEDDGSKTEIFNTVVRLTHLSEDDVIRLMENERANIITDFVDSIYDYNLTGDDSYKYTGEEVIDIVDNNIDIVLSEIDYYISASDRKEVMDYVRNNTDYILDVIYSTDIGGYTK